MNIHPRELTTIELISQQALEINRLNYKCSRLSDELTELFHPEFGIMWEYKETISELIKITSEHSKINNLKCLHVIDNNVDCLNCETLRVLLKAKSCINVISIDVNSKRNNENASNI